MLESVPPEALLIAVAAFLLFAILALLFAILAYAAARRAALRPILMRDEMIGLLRYESDLLRTAIDDSARSVRQETGSRLVEGTRGLQDVVKGLSDSLLKRTDAFGQRLDQMSSTSETQQAALRTMTETRFDQFVAAEAETGRELREELSNNLQRIKQGVNETLGQASEQQKERLDATERELKALAEVQKTTSEMLRQTVEGRLDLLRSENTAELEKMRATVDEKLQTTLEKRLGESFNSVVEQLNRAYEVFGEMKNISSSVSDLRNVLTNPKLRGTFGEVQLAMLIEDFLTPGQYIRDARVRDDSSERVEFAIRQPSADGDTVLLPVDAKFPREDHEAMIAAESVGNMEMADHHRKELERRIKSFAKDISRKYVNPPRTTEYAILFLPTESLFAEVLRQPGLFDWVRRECRVILAGPTTFSAILHAFQVNHRSMAIAHRSGEIREVLGAVRSEFAKYHAAVDKVGRQLRTAVGSVDELKTRTRQMDRALKTVETMPDEKRATRLLGLDSGSSLDLDDEQDVDSDPFYKNGLRAVD